MKAIIKEKITKFVECPGCQSSDSFEVTDLEIGERFGPCYCEHCGTVISGFVRDENNYEIGTSDEKVVPTLMLVKLEQTESLNVVLFRYTSEKMSNESAGDTWNSDEFIDSQEFLFNFELTPTIVLRHAVAVFKETVGEPDGIIKYVAARPFLEGFSEHLDEINFVKKSEEYFSDLLNQNVDTAGQV